MAGRLVTLRWGSVAWFAALTVLMALVLARNQSIGHAWQQALICAIGVQFVRWSGCWVISRSIARSSKTRTLTRDRRAATRDLTVFHTTSPHPATVHALWSSSTPSIIAAAPSPIDVDVRFRDWLQHQRAHADRHHALWAAMAQSLGLFVAFHLFLTIDTILPSEIPALLRLTTIVPIILAASLWDAAVRRVLDRQVERAVGGTALASAVVGRADLPINPPVCQWAAAEFVEFVEIDPPARA